ncbi:MAG: hypothetical protein KIY12_07985, partial [Thermoplasmata archaeon]|nr:hypothetical protein [Candidatus Sysuiplasma superficiale]
CNGRDAVLRRGKHEEDKMSGKSGRNAFNHPVKLAVAMFLSVMLLMVLIVVPTGRCGQGKVWQ